MELSKEAPLLSILTSKGAHYLLKIDDNIAIN